MRDGRGNRNLNSQASKSLNMYQVRAIWSTRVEGVFISKSHTVVRCTGKLGYRNIDLSSTVGPSPDL